MAAVRKSYLTGGYFVEMPIVLQVLLSPSELMVLNTIIHFSDLKGTDLKDKSISVSMFIAFTGRDRKTVRKALATLEHLGIIKRGKTGRDGTHYEPQNPRLTQLVGTLNKERNMINRLIRADRLRGKGYAIHSGVIKELTVRQSNNEQPF